MLAGALLSPLLWPLIFFDAVRGQWFYGHFRAVDPPLALALLALSAVVPVAGWALASRGAFAILIPPGVLVFLGPWPVFLLMAIWGLGATADRASAFAAFVATLMVAQVVLYPLGFWVIWRTAMGGHSGSAAGSAK
jgi:hypothetical protein